MTKLTELSGNELELRINAFLALKEGINLTRPSPSKNDLLIIAMIGYLTLFASNKTIIIGWFAISLIYIIITRATTMFWDYLDLE